MKIHFAICLLATVAAPIAGAQQKLREASLPAAKDDLPIGTIAKKTNEFFRQVGAPTVTADKIRWYHAKGSDGVRRVAVLRAARQWLEVDAKSGTVVMYSDRGLNEDQYRGRLAGMPPRLNRAAAAAHADALARRIGFGAKRVAFAYNLKNPSADQNEAGFFSADYVSPSGELLTMVFDISTAKLEMLARLTPNPKIRKNPGSQTGTWLKRPGAR
jgi:hypothetical protein